MKKQFYIILVLIVAVVFSACQKNDPITLQEKFVMFETTGSAVAETNNIIGIPVMIGAPGGQGTTFNFEFSTTGVANPAVEGVDFTLVNSDKSFTFSNYYGIDTIWIQTIDNDVYDRDKQVNIVLTSPTNGYKLAAEKMHTLTISDNEHPLALVIGSYSASATSYFNGAETYVITTSPDPNDETHLIISNFVAGGSNLDIYGIVDLDSDPMTIKIPVLQDLVSSATNPAEIAGFYGPTGADEILEGGFITGNIDASGNITILDEYGSRINSGANDGYWYNIYQSGGVWTKQ